MDSLHLKLDELTTIERNVAEAEAILDEDTLAIKRTMRRFFCLVDRGCLLASCLKAGREGL